MKEESLSKDNLINLVGLGKINPEDLNLTDEEKEDAEIIKNQTEKLKDLGMPVVWSTPDE